MAYITWGHDSRQPMFLITTSILLLLSLCAVILRIFCRKYYLNHVGIDDYFMLAALIVANTVGIMNGFHVSWGTGQHTNDLDLLHVLIPTLKHWYTYQIMYPVALFFVKASILALYHRIFTQTRFRYLIYFVAAFVSLFTLINMFVVAFECRTHPARAWSPTFPTGCNNLPATYFAFASINIFTDVVILIMPLREFGRLHMHHRKRLALMAIFMVGGIAVVASMIRLYALWVYTVSKDVAHDAIYILLLSQIEVNVAIISASAPSFRPLFSKAFAGFTQNSSYRSSASAGSARPLSRSAPGMHESREGEAGLSLSRRLRATGGVMDAISEEERDLENENVDGGLLGNSRQSFEVQHGHKGAKEEVTVDDSPAGGLTSLQTVLAHTVSQTRAADQNEDGIRMTVETSVVSTHGEKQS